jgi:hypothetical protein
MGLRGFSSAQRDLGSAWEAPDAKKGRCERRNGP